MCKLCKKLKQALAVFHVNDVSSDVTLPREGREFTIELQHARLLSTLHEKWCTKTDKVTSD